MFSRASTANTKSKNAELSSSGSSTGSSAHSSSSSGERNVPSIISADLTVTGDLHSAGEIQIDGAIEGDIHCVSLIIGISGSVTGEVKVDKLRLHGAVTGHVTAKSVFLASTARIMGDINHESLAVEPGAYMEGHCRRMTPPVDFSTGAIAAKPALPYTGGKAFSMSGSDDDDTSLSAP